MTPRFVPFESLSDAEQREHLRREIAAVLANNGIEGQHADLHGWRCAYPDSFGGGPCTCVGTLVDELVAAVHPHTHDKPAPRPEENR